MNPIHMTGAELQTLREGCHLGREEFAELAGVQARTVKHWENGRAGVPADVADLVRGCEDDLTQQTARGLDILRRQDMPGPIILVRHHTAESIPMPWKHPSLHGAYVARIYTALNSTDWARGRVRVIWHDDSAETDEDALQAQALPHRGDQPPA